MSGLALTPYEDPLARVGGWTFEGPAGRRPALRVEFANRRLGDGMARVGRVVAGDRVCTRFAIDGYWERVGLAAEADATPLGVLPPVTARAAAHHPLPPPKSPAETKGWRATRRPTHPGAPADQGPLRRVVEGLWAGPLSPLHPGRWWVGTEAEWPFSRPWIDLPELVARPPVALLDHFEWRLLPLRPFTGGRRVGFWQKQIQAGHCPPVVVLAVSVLEMLAVLDGHDRLEAAHREGVSPPLVLLAPLRTQRWPEDAHTEARRAGVAEQVARVDWDAIQPLSQQKLNDAVVGAWARPEHTYPRSRCWPVPGGFDAWLADLPAEAAPLRTLLP